MRDDSARHAAAPDAAPAILPHIEFRPATGVLMPYIESYYLFRNEAQDIEGIERVDLGQLRCMIRGEGEIAFPGGYVEKSLPIMVNGPGTAAARYRIQGPFHCFGLSLRAIGWRTLTGLPADKVADHIVDGSYLFGDQAPRVLAELRAATTLEDMIAIVQPLLEARHAAAKPVSRTHLVFLQAVREWAASGDPALELLYAVIRARSNIGERQVQRLCREYFGGSPAHLRRKFRAIGAAMRIYQGASVEEVVGPFSDQSHMINEIKHFTGHTPTSLRSGIDPVLAVTLDNETFHFLPDVIPEEVDLQRR